MWRAAFIRWIPKSRLCPTCARTYGSDSVHGNDAFFGSKVQRQQGDGSEFDALRDYAPGMDPRSIDWKHSARHRSLLSKEFQTERNHQIVLAFDTGQLMSEHLGAIPAGSWCQRGPVAGLRIVEVG